MILRGNQDNQEQPARCETYFAPAGRASRVSVRANIDLLASNPIADTLMQAVSGLMAILNEERQILVLNKALMQTLGIDDPEEVLGLRPGEAIKCVHAHDHPGGCGTSRHCATCGAAIAIVSALATSEAQEATCVATVAKNEREADLFFRVRCSPVVLEGKRFLLLFLQDCTVQQQQAALERVFFHDVRNTICGLQFACQLLDRERDTDRQKAHIARITQIARQLDREIEIQRFLTAREPHTFSLCKEEVDVCEAANEIRTLLSSHAVAADKTLLFSEAIPEVTISSDLTLVKRILANMLINAFEATEAGGTVRLWVQQSDRDVTFHVWNRQAIPAEQQVRVFQRNYSTKAASGRGLGTYSMKLFGETYLGGTVDFTSSETEGTTFRLSLPKRAGADA